MTGLEIEAFLTVQHTGSITKAAELLYISQSSLSIRLRTLERELGCPLFIRGRGAQAMLLTPEGERFLPLARQHRKLESKMRNLNREATAEQKLRVAAFSSVGNYLLPEVYRRFTQRYPDIRLRIRDITIQAAIAAIARDELDITFSTMNTSNEYITAIPFLEEPMAFLCAADSDYPDPVPLEALSVEREVYAFWCVDVRQWHRDTFGADAEPQAHLDQIGQMRLFVAQPGGWAIVPYSIAYALRDVPELRSCRMDFTVPNRCLYVLCNRRARNSQRVIRFLECLRSVMPECEMPGLLL